MALVMAIGIMAVLAITGTTLTYYATSNSGAANRSRVGLNAYALAESGLNAALSVLSTSFQAGTATALPNCPTTSSTVTYEGGTYVYCGTLNGSTWTITATGTIRNPARAGAFVTRTLTRSVNLLGITSGSTVGAWSRIYNDDTTACMSVPSGVVIPSNVATRGDLCLNGGQVTGSNTKVAVGGNVTSTVSTAPAQTLHAVVASTVTGGFTNLFNISDSDNFYATASISGGGNSSAGFDSTDLGFTIPADATINGITVKFERSASAAGIVSDQSIQLLKAGVPGSNKSVAATYGTADATVTYGSASDLWTSSWTPADINNSGFGFRFNSKCSGCAATTVKVDYIEITVNYTESGSYSQGPSIGGNGSGGAGQIAQLDVAGTCRWLTNPTHTPCTSGDRAYSLAYSAAPTGLIKPTVDFAYWYQNAAPGPKHGCDISSGTPPVFDSNTVYDAATAEQEITPEPGAKDDPGSSASGTIGNSSYTCKSTNASGTVIGELSWNNATRVLTVKGTIFFDGKASFHDHNGYIVHYQGRATIYIADSWHNDEAVCAGGSGLATCRTTSGMPNWDPTQNMLVIIDGDKNAAGTNDFDFHTDYSAFQGVLWSKNNCTIKETAFSSGPILCNKVIITNTPHFFPWPALGTLIDGQMYGSTSTSTDFLVQPGNQSG